MGNQAPWLREQRNSIPAMAAYAKAIGRAVEAASPAALASDAQATSAALSDLAKNMTNPAAQG